MKIELILARLDEYRKMLKVDEYQLEYICKLLEELLSDTEKSTEAHPSNTKPIVLTDIQVSIILQKLGTMSAGIKQLSPRRGSLMSRNSHIPWKLLMILDTMIHKMSIPRFTLINVITDMIKNHEISKLANQFKSFQKETKEKIESCQDYERFLNNQSQILIKLSEFEKQLTYKLNTIQQAHILISSIQQMIQEQKSNENKVQSRLDELKTLRSTIKDNEFLINIFNRWENEIGFDAKDITAKKKIVSTIEKIVSVQLKYYNELRNTLTDTAENIKNVRIGKDDQLTLSQLRSYITKMINDLTKATTEEDINNVKILCYKIFLKCLFFKITDNDIQNKLATIQDATMSNKEKYIDLLTKTQESINPFQEHKHALEEIKNSLTDKNKGFPYKIDLIISDKDNSKEQKLYKILQSNLKKLLSFKEQKAKSTLSSHIESLIGIYTNDLLINTSIDPALVSDKIATGTTDRLMNKIDQLKTIYTAIDKEKSGEEIQDTALLFEKVQKYTSIILQEQKSEHDQEADLNFCPSLCRFLQYNFDLKNIETILITSKKLIDMLKQEDALDNPLLRITFLYSLLILGESTKDLSYEMKNHNKDIPWYLMKSIRNKIFHALFDVKEGRDVFWQFLIGTNDKLSKQLLATCMHEIKNLYHIFNKMQYVLKPNISWDIYPTYKGHIKSKAKTTVSILSATIRSIINETMEQEPSQEISDNEKMQQLSFPKLNLLLKTLSTIDIQPSKTTALTKRIPEQEREIIKTLDEISAVENFFHNMVFNLPSLKITYRASSVETILSEPQLTPVCHIGIAFCGGLLKLLKDFSNVFEAHASPLLLLNAENIIYLRGELAHAVAVKDSSVELNTLLSLNDSIVPLLRITACHIQLAQLPPVLNIQNEYDLLVTKFKSLESLRKYTTLQNAANILSLNKNKFKENEIKTLIETYKALQFYSTYDFSDKQKIIEEIKQLQHKCNLQYDTLSKQLILIKQAYHDLQKYKESKNKEFSTDMSNQLILIEQQINNLEKTINDQRKNASLIKDDITELIDEIDAKIITPKDSEEVHLIINQSYKDEYKLIDKFEKALKRAIDRRESIQDKLNEFDDKLKALEQITTKRLLHLGNDPNALMNELKAVPGSYAENQKQFLANLHDLLDKSISQYFYLYKQYKTISAVYEESITEITEKIGDIDDIKNQKNNLSDIVKIYDQEIKKEKGIPTNKLKLMAQNIDKLAFQLDQVAYLTKSLSKLKYFSEPRNTHKYIVEKNDSENKAVSRLATSQQSRFFSKENILAINIYPFKIPTGKLNHTNRNHLKGNSSNNGVNHTSLKPLIDANLLDKNLIKYGLITAEEIKKLSYPDIQTALLSNEISIQAARKMTDVQINRVISATTSPAKRAEVIQEILEEHYHPKPIAQKKSIPAARSP